MRKLPNGGIECSDSVCIGQAGRVSIRSVGVGGQWFDVFIDEFKHLHGTKELAEAWVYLSAPLVRLRFNMGDGETRFPQGSTGLLIGGDGHKCTVHFIDPRKKLTCRLNEIERL